MNIAVLFADKTMKPKVQVVVLADAMIDGNVSVDDVIAFATSAKKDTLKANCIEALEFATRKDASIINDAAFVFVTNMLLSASGRIKWESAKVIGNTAQLFIGKLDDAISNLLVNTNDISTVVRWSAAYAFSLILKYNPVHSTELVDALKVIANNESKPSIKKLYIIAFKQHCGC